MVQDEWDRLKKDPFHELEFDTTIRYLEKYLPKKGLILDAGGGPGRYTIELLKRGYQVVLLDIVKENLDFAKEKIEESNLQNNLKNFTCGSITDLSCFEDSSFDAVLCLGGPLSHVETTKLRVKATSELVRVAKANSSIFISVMAKYGVIPLALHDFAEEVGMTKHFRNFWKNGEDDRWNGGKGYSHYFTSEELDKILESKGTKIITNVGLESFATPVRKDFNMITKDKKIYKNWIEMHYALCEEQAAVNASVHFLTIAKKL